ncbi:MAG TPA: hypothetical protein VMS74_05190 [Acidimicrobiia bacterium]|nr:hypothetical protein [Acidimicrobiia bacterium]
MKTNASHSPANASSIAATASSNAIDRASRPVVSTEATFERAMAALVAAGIGFEVVAEDAVGRAA